MKKTRTGKKNNQPILGGVLALLALFIGVPFIILMTLAMMFGLAIHFESVKTPYSYVQINEPGTRVFKEDDPMYKVVSYDKMGKEVGLAEFTEKKDIPLGTWLKMKNMGDPFPPYDMSVIPESEVPDQAKIANKRRQKEIESDE
ncbi:hypothetical protein D3P96_01695 [Weissella viridescens]|uniref:Uncharacterized protein n=1 Tax=Weissella viridescens TaxID=1629 RepID=A0A3P2RDK0_WEIVI|nr:hypothetical protein [Weissella viridescens]RRG18723.1 hypothetical protein D3P96_01695 [Weissella viridescens]